jgi:putative ABC transport system permease protein
VIVIGTDPEAAPGLPRPSAASTRTDAVVVDASDLDLLGLDTVPAEVELGGRRARVERAVTGFASFLGSPYVFTTHADARRFTKVGAEKTSYLVCRVAPGFDRGEVAEALRERFPDADVRTGEEFSRRSRSYWILQTGAGGAILIAGLLGFVVGVVIVSQTIYATTMENLEEFATLRAMGASRGYVMRLVIVQAFAGGIAGYLAGLLASLPLLAALRGTIPWVHTPWWMPVGMLGASLAMAALASITSVRTVVRVEPGRVFRA